MTQIPTPSNNAPQDAPDQSASELHLSTETPTHHEGQDDIGVLLPTAHLEMTEINYYTGPKQKRRRTRMQTASGDEKRIPARRSSDVAGSRGRFLSRWGNLGMRSKLAILLMLSAVIPTVGLAQGLITVNKGRAFQDAKEKIAQDAQVFRDAHVLWYETDGAARAKRIADIVGMAKANLNDSSSVVKRRIELQNYVTLEDGLDPSVSHNFQILTNRQGQSVVQDIRLLKAPESIPTTEQEARQAVYGRVTASVGVNLARLPLVQQVLETGEPASGIEIIDAETVKALKLDLQTSLTLENSEVLEGGKAAMSSIAVYPIVQNGQVNGTAIVGTIYNRHQTLPDVYSTRHKTSAAAVFAEDVQIATTEGIPGQKTRNVGKTAPGPVVRKVLEQEQPALEISRVDGSRYLGYYLPLYQATEPAEQDTPIGMVYVGQSLKALDRQFLTQQVTTYTLGIAILGLAGLLAVPAAASITEPLRRLSGFMARIGRGDRRLRMTDVYRMDEVGVLTNTLNHMVAGLEKNEIRLQQELTRNRILSKIANLRSLDSESVTAGLQEALEEARQFLNCDRLVIYRCGTTTEGSRVMYEAKLPGIPSAVDLNVSDHCIPANTLASYQAGEHRNNPDVYQAGFGPEHIQLLEQLWVKASLIMPVHSSQSLYGLLVAHDCQGPRQWTPGEEGVMRSIADQVAITLGYTTLLEQRKASEEAIRQDKEFFQQRALELLQEVDPVSQGDLTVRAKVTEDEIGTIADSYNATVQSLRSIVEQVQLVSAQVSGTAEQNEAAVQKLAAEALLQSEQVTASMEQMQVMTATAQSLSEQASAAQQAVATTTQTVEQGDLAMTLAVEGMITIRETVADTTRKMEDLEDASQRISQVIRLISGFAAQTHMLAMKASIEAARAGEHGEGFAVIAEEVRTLAARSAQATADVEAIISSIQLATQDMLMAMSTENQQVQREMQLVNDSRASLNQITAASAQMNQLVTSIAQATVDQTKTSDATRATVADVAQLVRQTSQEANDVSASFKELLATAQTLQAQVARFKVR